ncbi:MAG TPA: sugar transferase, partial [Gammaproteobacteria bacterium]|nr:sugar transferase [Gammaproteobacteria bacterium]
MRQGVMRDYSSTISLLTRIFDVALVAACGWGAHALRFAENGPSFALDYAPAMLIGALLAALLFPAMGLYQSWRARGLLAPVGRVFSATVLLFFLLLALLGLVHEVNALSRLWFAYWAASTALAMIGVRVAIYWGLHALRAHGHNQRNVIIIGSGPKAKELIRKTKQNTWSGYRVSAVFGDPATSTHLGKLPVTPLETLAGFVGSHPVDEIWIALPLDHSKELRAVLDSLRTSSANVRYAPDLLGLYLLNHGVSNLFETPMIDLTASPIQGTNRLVKAIEDRVLAALILALTSPLLLLLAIGVKLSSPGPVLYRQDRLGWNGRPFTML